jgi:F1F0 ATPase subunit 2
MRLPIGSMLLFSVTIGLLIGAILGMAYFKMLRSAVLRYREAARVSRLLLVQLGRFALAAATFAMLSTLGASALLAGLAGFLLMRRLAMRRLGAAL